MSNVDAINAATLLGEAMRKEWQSFVAASLLFSDSAEVSHHVSELSTRCLVGEESLKRKIEAIRHASSSLGYTPEEIVRMGQEKTLSLFLRSKRQEKYTETVVMKWSVLGCQRELVQQQEKRIKALLGLQTSEQFFDWLLAQLQNATDEEIKQSAGEGNAESQGPRA